ncbi:MAG: hypothetical protein ACP5RX_02270 [Minisyncoccia bacterium]
MSYGKEQYDTHHIVPVSIGGSNTEQNRIKVPKEQHAMYHKLFNNYHPSSILRFVFDQILPWCFGIYIDFKNEPYFSFVQFFDEKMFQLWGSSSCRHYESLEETKAILQFASHSQKQKDKIGNIKLILYQFCIYHHTSDWSPTGLLKQIFFWFKLKPEEYREVIKEIKKLESNKGH